MIVMKRAGIFQKRRNNIIMPQYDCKLLKVPPRPVSPPELKICYPGMDSVPLPRHSSPTKFSAGLSILIKHICKRISLRNLWTEKSFPMKLEDLPQATQEVLPCHSSTSTTKIKVCNFASKYAQGCWITGGKQLYNWSDKIDIKRSIQGYNSSFADSKHEVTETSMDRYHAFSTGISCL